MQHITNMKKIKVLKENYIDLASVSQQEVCDIFNKILGEANIKYFKSDLDWYNSYEDVIVIYGVEESPNFSGNLLIDYKIYNKDFFKKYFQVVTIKK